MPRIPTVRFDGDRLRELIQTHRLTRTELGARAGVSAALVSKALLGKPIGRLAAIALARGLRVRLADLEAREAEVVT